MPSPDGAGSQPTGDDKRTAGVALNAEPSQTVAVGRAASVKRRAKAVAAEAKAGFVSTVTTESAPLAELVGESRLERPEARPVNVPERRDRNLIVRMAAGAVYVAINVLAILWGKVPTALVMALTAGICCWEFFRLMRADAKTPNQIIGISFSVLMPLVALINIVYLVGVVFLMVMVLGMWYVANQRARITDVAITAFGAIYTGMTLSALVSVRCTMSLEQIGAIALCIGIMASVWINDSFAYLVGSKFGKHKMVPKISPKKSWEGLAGGIAGSLLVWFVLMLIPQTNVSWQVALVCGLVCGVTGVIGDLVESRIKRGAGIKDSGNLIPGHGGLLDRSDSMLFVSISAYFILRMMGVL